MKRLPMVPHPTYLNNMAVNDHGRGGDEVLWKVCEGSGCRVLEDHEHVLAWHAQELIIRARAQAVENMNVVVAFIEGQCLLEIFKAG
jgi:hypothetical protein